MPHSARDKLPRTVSRTLRALIPRLGHGLLAGWALLLLLIVTSLAAAHTYTLPRPATQDPWLARAVAAHRLPSERDFFALHVLYTSCRCSTRILSALEARQPEARFHESVLLVGSPAGHDQKLGARGFRVSVLSPSQLFERFRLRAAPVLIVAGPDQRVRYVGGYSDRKQGAVLRDRELMAEALRDEQSRELPLFGCAVSRELQRMIDPFRLQRYARDEELP